MFGASRKNTLVKFRLKWKTKQFIFILGSIKYSILQLRFTVRLSHERNAENESLKMSLNKGSDLMERIEKRL